MTKLEKLRYKLELLEETAPDKWIESVISSITDVLDIIEEKKALGFKNGKE